MTDYRNIPPYDDEKQAVNVIIETPKGSRNKFAFDKEKELFTLKFVLPAGAAFPFDFGFVPNTVGDDGDPIDVLVLMDEPAFTGCHVPVRMIGAIEAQQSEEGGGVERNDRLIGVAATAKLYEDVKSLSDISDPLIDQIEHFFISYNMERGRKFEPKNRVGPRKALELIEAGRKKASAKRRGRRKTGK